jgi:predicted branched-subunit amino acid permease
VQAWWVAGGLLGALGGAALGDIEGAEFALTATFVILALQACRIAPDRVAPIIGLVCGLLAVVLVPAQALLVGSGALVLILTLMFRRGSTHA